MTLIEARTNEMLPEIAAAFGRGSDAKERIAGGGAFLDSLARERREWCLLYMEFWSRAVRDPKLRRRFARNYASWRHGIGDLIGRQFETLGLSGYAAPEELASALIAFFEGQILQRLIDPSALEDGFFERLLLRFFGRMGVLKD